MRHIARNYKFTEGKCLTTRPFGNLHKCNCITFIKPMCWQKHIQNQKYPTERSWSGSRSLQSRIYDIVDFMPLTLQSLLIHKSISYQIIHLISNAEVNKLLPVAQRMLVPEVEFLRRPVPTSSKPNFTSSIIWILNHLLEFWLIVGLFLFGQDPLMSTFTALSRAKRFDSTTHQECSPMRLESNSNRIALDLQTKQK